MFFYTTSPNRSTSCDTVVVLINFGKIDTPTLKGLKMFYYYYCYYYSATKQAHQEKQMTRTLLCITFSFLVLLAWQCITQCFWMLGYGRHDQTQPNKWRMVDSSFALAKLGIIINSSINWVFYCCTCSMFRKEMRKMFGLLNKKDIPSVQPDQFCHSSSEGVNFNSLSPSNGGESFGGFFGRAKNVTNSLEMSSTITVNTGCDPGEIYYVGEISISNVWKKNG